MDFLKDLHPSIIKDIASNQRQENYQLKSDPLFMEAIRKDAAGDTEGAEAARAQALEAVADIKAKYPLPEVDA